MGAARHPKPTSRLSPMRGRASTASISTARPRCWSDRSRCKRELHATDQARCQHGAAIPRQARHTAISAVFLLWWFGGSSRCPRCPGPAHRSTDESDRRPSPRWHSSGTARTRHHRVARRRSVHPPHRGAFNRRLGLMNVTDHGKKTEFVSGVLARGLRARHRPNPEVSALPDQDGSGRRSAAAPPATAHHAAPRPSARPSFAAPEGQGRCGGVVGASAERVSRRQARVVVAVLCWLDQ